MSDRKSGLLMVCGVCNGHAGRDAHGNIWHVEGRSDKCDVTKSVPHYRFVSPESVAMLRAKENAQ